MRFIGAAMLLLISLSARAQLLGSTVDVTARYSDVATIFTDGGAAIVSKRHRISGGYFRELQPELAGRHHGQPDARHQHRQRV